VRKTIEGAKLDDPKGRDGLGTEGKPCGVLNELLIEARGLPVPDIDWNRIDAALFAKVELEASHAKALAAFRGRPSPWLLIGGVAAIAAAAVVMLQPLARSTLTVTDVSHSPPQAGGLPAAGASAGDLTFVKDSGEVRIDGTRATPGAHTRLGESIETHGTKAAFQATGRAAWLLENESRIAVERAGGEGSPIVLTLERGAVEAQVGPVPSGEAFAVDVAGVRIAVHGTHLRVARDGNLVTVDLNEGVVSIGARPKIGSTYGKLVTAPAHVEFQADALQTSLTVAHDTGTVRKAVDLSSAVTDEVAAAGVVVPSSPKERSSEDPGPSPPTRATGSPRPTVVARNPNAEEVIQSAVRTCASLATLHSSDLRIIQNSTLTVVVQDDGFAHNASFDPPMPDLQDCAARSIWATRFVDPGPHTIKIAVER
jgi:hypothetical protein